MLPKMKASHFVKKHSVQFVSESGKLSTPFYFMENKPHECSQTWQVVRSEFDEMMLNNAQEHGVQVRQGVRVLDIILAGDRAVGVEIIDEQGERHRINSEVVVDASGQSSLMINKLRHLELLRGCLSRFRRR
jgi:flavin-dependent dehydrogenase